MIIKKSLRFQVVYDVKKDQGGKRIQKVRSFNSLEDAKQFAKTLSPDFRKAENLSSSHEKWSREDVSKFLDAVQKEDNGLIFEILLYTDLRINELCALFWSDIDLCEAKISINKTSDSFNNRKVNIYSLRNKRMISIPSHITEKLAIYKNRKYQDKVPLIENNQNEQLLVFTNKVGTAINPRSLEYRFKRIVKNANVKMISFRDFRYFTPEYNQY
ncbi:tyrosine-type recombinase/integrase [Priestia megaterium]|nr:tyrosine-type recombinase/integrase [Priestia megaterium]